MNVTLTGVYPLAYIDRMGIAERIDQMMQKRQIKGQSAISRASGVPQPTIARILKGRNIPELATLVKLGAALGVTASWLAEGPDDAPEYTQTKLAPMKPDAGETFRQAQIEMAKELLSRMENADLSRAVAMLIDFASELDDSTRVAVKIARGGRSNIQKTQGNGE